MKLFAAALLVFVGVTFDGVALAETCPEGQVWSEALEKCVSRRSNGNGEGEEGSISADCEQLRELDPTIPCS